MSRKPHEPNADQRNAVQLHTTIGTDQETIARILGIDAKTLRKHYRDELDLSLAKANATIGGAIVPLLMGFAADRIGLALALLVPAVCYAWIACYGVLVESRALAAPEPAAVAGDA